MYIKFLEMVFRRPFISRKDEKALIAAITEAEQHTSAELRIHIENRRIEDTDKRSYQVFEKLKMTATEHRNGILIYINPKYKRLAITADEGINQLVNKDFWEQNVENIISHFKTDDYLGGLLAAIEVIGSTLRQHFPYQSDDVDELPNSISR